MAKPLSGKIALVTASSGGIGKAIGERLAEDGAHVIINYRSNKEDAGLVVRGIEEKKGAASAIQADISKISDIEKMMKRIKDDFGRIDLLVNNAGTSARSTVEETTEEMFDFLINLNVKGTLFVTKMALPMIPSGGSIVYVSSSVTEFVLPGGSVYTATKMANRAYTFVQAQELGAKGITVNTVMPGPTAPGRFDLEPEDVKKMAIESSPFKRIGAPEDIAGVVSFLVGKDARWVTGQHILVNGGASM